MKKNLLMLVLLVILSACRAEKVGEAKMLRRDEVTAHCIGRQNLSMPRSFVLSSVTTGSFKPTDFGPQDPAIEMTVRAGELSASQFAAAVGKRRDELKALGDDATDILRLDKPLSDAATLFRVQRVKDAYVSEINLLRASSLITVRLKSFEDGFIAAEAHLMKFIAEIRADDSRIPRASRSGFCLGPVSITGDYSAENGKFLFSDGKGSAFGIEIDTYKADPSVPLLTRVGGSDSLLNVFDVRHTVLRSRERTVSGMRAQEWLAWTKLGGDGDQKTFGFTLETMRPKAGIATPSVHLSFDTGRPSEDGTQASTFLSDQEAIELWDFVVESIRPGTS